RSLVSRATSPPAALGYALSLHDALPIFPGLLGQDVDEADLVVHRALVEGVRAEEAVDVAGTQVGHHLRRRRHADLHVGVRVDARSEEHTSELQSRENLVCRLLLENKKRE